MRRLHGLVTCGCVLLGTVCFGSTSVPNEKAMNLLHTVAQRYKNAAVYHLEVVKESQNSSELYRYWGKEYATYARGADGRHHYELKNSNGWIVVLSDGSAKWTISPWKKEYVKGDADSSSPASKEQARQEPMDSYPTRQAEFWMKTFSTVDDAVRQAELLPPEVITVGGKDIKCSVIRAEYEPPRMLNVENYSNSRTYWIDSSNVVRKERVLSSGRLMPAMPLADVTSEETWVYTVAELGAAPESLFHFEPASDFRLVDRLSGPGVRASLTGQPAPPINLKTLDGKQISNDALRGKVLVVDFWATYCKPCLAQMPVLAKINNDFKDQGVAIIGINSDANPKLALEYLQKNNYEWTNLYDERLQAGKAWGTDAIPTLAVVDTSGKVALWRVGYNPADEAELRSLLQKLTNSHRE